MGSIAGNPFTPSFGHAPFALAGRDGLIDDIVGGLANRPGDPNRTTIFVGPRGSGKTVLLTELAGIASEQGWTHASATARPGMLDKLLFRLRDGATHLLAPESTAHVASLNLGPFGVGIEREHLAVPWHVQASALVAELNAAGGGVLFTIDEVNPRCDELIELVDTYQHFVREDREVALLLAGLPGNVSALLLDEQVSFIRRAFQRPLGAIPAIEVEQALLDTIEGNGRSIEPDALALAAEATRGFAFAIQLVGYYLWRQDTGSAPYKVADARRAVELANAEMERSVFVPTLQELRPREVEYLHAMAQDDGPSSTSKVAARMGVGMSNASNLRRRLIEHGVIRSERLGLVDFELPGLKEYLAG